MPCKRLNTTTATSSVDKNLTSLTLLAEKAESSMRGHHFNTGVNRDRSETGEMEFIRVSGVFLSLIFIFAGQ